MRRRYLRAPLSTTLLYEDEGHVLKASTLNISVGGILIKELPRVPKFQTLPLMLSLPRMPDFQQFPRERVLALRKDDFDKNVFRVQCRIIRTFDKGSSVDHIFTTHIGCEITHMSDETKDFIHDYVVKFSKNVVFLLGLFESGMNQQGHLHLLRHVSDFMGYDGDQKISILRQKILHDYQSLEGL